MRGDGLVSELWGIANLFEYAEFNDVVNFFRFWLEKLLLGKFGPKNLNCHLQLKFGK